MKDELGGWKQVAQVLHGALPQIDRELSEANVPISKRLVQAFDVVQETMLEVGDEEAFLLSEAHGRLRIIVADWYRDRYGGIMDNEEEAAFMSMILVHGTPFPMRVPHVFKKPAEEPNVVWIGFPASVQQEEDPVRWIQGKGVVDGLSDEEMGVVRTEALARANLIRSIGYDIRSLEHDANRRIAKLAGSVRADLQSSARNLCERKEAGVRSAAWDVSQATEKAFKVLIRRKGERPPRSHDLSELAEVIETLGGGDIDRQLLALIPSGSDATNLRYGGELSLSEAVDSYVASLSIIRDVVFEAKPDLKFSFREGRLKLRRPPWFEFDTERFSKELDIMD